MWEREMVSHLKIYDSRLCKKMTTRWAAKKRGGRQTWTMRRFLTHTVRDWEFKTMGEYEIEFLLVSILPWWSRQFMAVAARLLWYLDVHRYVKWSLSFLQYMQCIHMYSVPMHVHILLYSLSSVKYEFSKLWSNCKSFLKLVQAYNTQRWILSHKIHTT
jgi:hypothetical protein